MNQQTSSFSVPVLISLLISFSSASYAQDEHACAASTPAQIAALLKLEEGSVVEQNVYASRDGVTTTECQWQYLDQQGQKTFINFRKRERTEKLKNPLYFASSIENEIDNGRKIGGKTVHYEALELLGLTNGAISTVHGNRFTKSLEYQWHESEERRKRLSLARNISDEGTLAAPTQAELEALLVLFK